MDVIVKETDTFDREVTVSIAADRVATLLDQELARMAKTARLPGFRPGKIPKQVMETRFRDHLSQSIIEQVLQETYLEVLKQHDLHPVDHEPRIQMGKVARGEPFTYTAHIQVYPLVEPKGYTGLTLTQRHVEITDADVDAMIQRIRTEQAQFVVEAGRRAELGDQVILDFDGRVDGERFAGGQASRHTLELGLKRFIDTFEEQLVGCAAGDERQVRVTFPEGYSVQDLAGKEATFDCTIHEVLVRHLPPEDDALAERAGVKTGGLAELRVEIAQTLRDQVAKESKQQLKKAILTQVLAANPLELPSRLVQRECRTMLTQAKREYEQQGMSLTDLGIGEQYLMQQFVKPAQERITLGMVLGEIADRERLVVDEAAVEARLDEVSAAYGERANAMKKWVRDNEERLESLRNSVLEQQVIDWIQQNSTVTIEACTFDELMGKPSN
ncbi:MAG: trigger factor [Magnetococcales bacterium]|nr:trigger factor [Magnetococcales bacterium]